MAITDIYGREWNLPQSELCPTCQQPDNCGDCTHAQLSSADVQHLTRSTTPQGDN